MNFLLCLVVLSLYLSAVYFLTWSFIPRFLKLMIQVSSQLALLLVSLLIPLTCIITFSTNELYQLALVAFCLLASWCSDKLGLNLQLGSFVVGVMISTTDFVQHTLD